MWRRFAHRLAVALGVWNVDEMLAAMTWDQFMDWVHFYNLEPWGEERADLRTGIVASVIANANRDRKKRPRPYEAKDFMPRFGGAAAARKNKPPMTREEYLALKSMAKAMGKKKKATA